MYLRICELTPLHIFPIYTFKGEINNIKLQIPTIKPPSLASLCGSKVVTILGNENAIKFENRWRPNT